MIPWISTSTGPLAGLPVGDPVAVQRAAAEPHHLIRSANLRALIAAPEQCSLSLLRHRDDSARAAPRFAPRGVIPSPAWGACPRWLRWPAVSTAREHGRGGCARHERTRDRCPRTRLLAPARRAAAPTPRPPGRRGPNAGGDPGAGAGEPRPGDHGLDHGGAAAAAGARPAGSCGTTSCTGATSRSSLIMYVPIGARRDGRLSPPAHPSQLQDLDPGCAACWRCWARCRSRAR